MIEHQQLHVETHKMTQMEKKKPKLWLFESKVWVFLSQHWPDSWYGCMEKAEIEFKYLIQFQVTITWQCETQTNHQD